jgi:hypothetical protein
LRRHAVVLIKLFDIHLNSPLMQFALGRARVTVVLHGPDIPASSQAYGTVC